MSHRKLGFPSNYQQQFPERLGINVLRRLFDNGLWRMYTRAGGSSLAHKLIFLPSEAYAMWNHLTGDRIDFSRSFLLNEQARPEERDRIRAYFERMLLLQGKERLAFKITGPSRIGYLMSIFPDARFLYIKRNLVPTLSSFLKVNFWKSRGYDRLWFTGAYNSKDLEQVEKIRDRPELITTFQLKRLNDVADYEIEVHQPNIGIFEYEDFLKDTENNLSQMLDFLDLDKDDACFDYLEKNKVRSNLRSNEELFPKDVLASIEEVLDYQWESSLPLQEEGKSSLRPVALQVNS